jgi:hypothetical protein
MRRPIFAVSLSFALLSLPLACAAQHGPVAPAVAPAPAMHAAPMHAAPVGTAHGNVHAVRPYSPGSSNRTAVHGTAVMKPPVGTASGTPPNTPSPNTPWHKLPQPTNTLPTFPPQVPNAPVLLPGNIFSGQSCFLPYNCLAVPGNGFDYSHFFAVHPNWGSPILTAGVVVPFSDSGGFYVPVPYYYPPQVAPEEQQGPPPPGYYPPDQFQGQNQGNNVQNQVAAQPQPPAPSTPAYSAPSEPLYEYVFVKRDGTKIFAVAYSLTKDNLQYITKEGLRRTLPLTALDFEATQKSNEERGNSVTLPSPPPAAMAMAL